MRCIICGRFIKPNSYNACEYPRYCYEKAAMKECEPLSKVAESVFRPSLKDYEEEEEE